MKSQDEKIRQMLQNLGRALIDAINDSSEVHGMARRLCDQGYSLEVRLDCQGDSDGRPQVQVGAVQARPAPLPAEPQPVPVPPVANPTFTVNTDDVDFLRSVGIDGTRSVRRRRSSSRR